MGCIICPDQRGQFSADALSGHPLVADVFVQGFAQGLAIHQHKAQDSQRSRGHRLGQMQTQVGIADISTAFWVRTSTFSMGMRLSAASRSDSAIPTGHRVGEVLDNLKAALIRDYTSGTTHNGA